MTFSVDGKQVRQYSNVPFKLGPCTLALGLMSEKDIAPGKGSVSCHGQGAVGKWGNNDRALGAEITIARFSAAWSQKMEFAGFGHVTLTVSNYDACPKFYDRLMTHIGMRRYFESPLGVGWFADEYMFVMGHAAPAGDRFSQWRTGLHHLSFRARSRDEVDSCYAMLKEIGAKIIFPAEPGPFWPGYYSVVFEDPDGTRLEMNYIPPKAGRRSERRQTQSRSANLSRSCFPNYGAFCETGVIS